jgi:L-iditol 2-dehydrogenase
MLHYAADAAYPFPPGTTGHEMVGFVEAIDAPGSELQVGDAVLALAPGHRAMAEFYLAPLEHVIPLPAGMPLEVLLQAQQFGTVLFACQRLPNVIAKNVVVIGQGSAGLFYDFQLRRMGARRVIAMDIDACRLERAKRFLATHTVHNAAGAGSGDPRTTLDTVREITGGQLADLVIEAAGEVAAINLAIDLVRPNGDILFFGYPRGQTIQFEFDNLFHKCCHAHTIVGSSVEANQLSTRIALDFITSGQIDVSPLITHRVPFSGVIDAYEMHRTRGDHCLKIVIEMPE